MPTGVLLRAILRIAKGLGRWWVEWLAERGLVRLDGYMTGKIADFKRRLPRLKGKRHRKLLRRIGRWERALRWVRRQRENLLRWLDRAYCRGWSELQRLPLVAAGERC
jgi:hypothetical protein